MEARDPDGESTAKHLQTIFAGRFLDLRYTMHPGDIPGEAPGKSSNVSWAAKDVQRRYHDSAASKDVLVTVMDSKWRMFQRVSHGLINLLQAIPTYCPSTSPRSRQDTGRLLRVATWPT